MQLDKIKKLFNGKHQSDILVAIELLIGEIEKDFGDKYDFKHLEIQSKEFEIHMTLPIANNEWTNLAFDIYRKLLQEFKLIYISWSRVFNERKLILCFNNYKYHGFN